jgi:hypothetical protein
MILKSFFFITRARQGTPLALAPKCFQGVLNPKYNHEIAEKNFTKEL